MLDNTLGWAWGYAGADRRVGYVRAEALVSQLSIATLSETSW